MGMPGPSRAVAPLLLLAGGMVMSGRSSGSGAGAPTAGRREGMLRPVVLAGGCFWGVQASLDAVPGVERTRAGYANGHVEHPSYEDVCRGDTGHAEAVEAWYDPERISLRALLRGYLSLIDPTARCHQGADWGPQYRTGIYVMGEDAEADLAVAAEILDEEARRLGRPLAVELGPLRCFWPAEERHQRYLEKATGGPRRVDLSRFVDEEARGRTGGGRLGHVSEDGPVDRDGLRCCIDGAALRSAPLADLEREGLGELRAAFEGEGAVR